MRLSLGTLTAASLLMASACGQVAKTAELSSVQSGSQEQKSLVPAAIATFTGHEICSGKVTEVWTNPVDGKTYRQVWERRASFADFVQKDGHFSVGYKVAVNSQYYVQQTDGSWAEDKKTTFDSLLQFNGVFSQDLGRYVGQTKWLSSTKQGQAVDLTSHSDQKITSIMVEDGKLVMKYVDVFPGASSETSPAHLNKYDETLALVDGKLERTWSYQTWGFDTTTLEPTTVLDFGAKPSFDTEAKCAE